ncbi:hypothetical protein DFH09DRAFT_1117757 [Mycena vulgaris]|nr:hypothetical protein DFH09DRAFT_1117757 [Mycena vulgaris]
MRRRTSRLMIYVHSSLASAPDFVLLNVQYDVFKSPVPVFFIRSSPSLLGAPPRCLFTQSPVKRSYGEYEYITITLPSEIAAGATGITHAAMLQVSQKYTAFRGSRRQLHHERFAASVSGRLRPDPQNVEFSVSPAQRFGRAQFLVILENIHRAAEGDAAIIDFDRAEIIDFDRADVNPTAGTKRREMEKLINLLDHGSYHDPSMPSVSTTQGSVTDEDSASQDYGDDGGVTLSLNHLVT